MSSYHSALIGEFRFGLSNQVDFELCAKSEQWKYEQEVRVIRSLAGCEDRGPGPRGFTVYTQQLPQACIMSVTPGERTPVPEQRAIYDAVKAQDFRTTREVSQ